MLLQRLLLRLRRLFLALALAPLLLRRRLDAP